MELRRRLRQGEPPNLELENPTDSADALHAASLALGEECGSSPRIALAEASLLWNALSASPWKDDELEERVALLCSFAFTAWRSARILGLPAAAHAWERTYEQEFRGSVYWDLAAAAFESDSRARLDKRVRDPEDVFQTLIYLYDQRESAPRAVAVHAARIHEAIAASESRLPSDLESFLLGFSARVAGIGNRALGLFEEAIRWLDLAEGHFEKCPDSSAQLGRVTYQRLAVFYSLDRFDVIAKVAPALEKMFAELGMVEDSFKCRILWSASLKCVGESEIALEVLEPLRELRARMSPSMYGWVLMELGDINQINGNYDLGLHQLTEAAQLLRDTNQRTGWATSISMMGFGYRSQGKLEQAIHLFRKAQTEYASLDMKALEAYVRLLVCETYLAMGRWRAAEEEAREIVQVFEEHRMITERVAALTLLREAVRRRNLDPQMLRDLRERLRPGTR